VLTLDQILVKMRANYEPVVASLPPKLQEEFRTKVRPLEELEESTPMEFVRTMFTVVY
jgi:hypothetical protein